ncbi:ribosomal protein RPS24 [Toxoplasma gondii ARI]|uniref:40S ribosomal protein S24 n=1 Tax=Toxoplasma gondii ARI TaxID=1074872 RepID=A0A139XVJ7_TOXGO|nr:ribosomal protein RPS24 [Toxoplasma gondii ARI]
MERSKQSSRFFLCMQRPPPHSAHTPRGDFPVYAANNRMHARLFIRPSRLGSTLYFPAWQEERLRIRLQIAPSEEVKDPETFPSRFFRPSKRTTDGCTEWGTEAHSGFLSRHLLPRPGLLSPRSPLFSVTESNMADSGAFSLRFRKLKTNPLLQRKQFGVDILHPSRGSVSKKELVEKIAKQFRVSDSQSIVVFGLKTAFGGGRSSGFAMIYDNPNAAKKFENRFRLVRLGYVEAKPTKGRRAYKELKNRRKKVRGKEKAKCSGAAKK